MASQYWDEFDLKQLLAGGLINEDVMQRIWDISRIPLPFTDLVGTGAAARQSFTEWTQDELADPDTGNAAVSGSDASGNDARGGSRVGNHCQTSTKVVAVTERSRSTDTIGRADEFSYQLMMRQQELRRDVEAISLSRQPSQADNNDDVPGLVGGFPSWLTTNVDFGGGSAGGFNTATRLVDAPTAGGARSMTEARMKARIEQLYNSNGNPTAIMSVPGVIARISAYMLSENANVARPTANVAGASGAAIRQTSQGFVNVVVTDFGFTLTLIPNRLQQTHDSTDATPVPVADVFYIDPGFVEFAYLRSFRTAPLAKLGLSDRAQISVDWTLRVGTEKAHGLTADIDPTAAMTAGA